jgi:hypothetical protein
VDLSQTNHNLNVQKKATPKEAGEEKLLWSDAAF